MILLFLLASLTFSEKDESLSESLLPIVDESSTASQAEGLDQRLGGYSPLMTNLRLSTIPFLFAFYQVVEDSIDQYFLKANYEYIYVPKDGGKNTTYTATDVISACANLKMICDYACTFILEAAAIKFGELFTKNRMKEASNVFVDLFRLGVILEIVISAILIPICKWYLRKTGLDSKNCTKYNRGNDLVDLGFKYLLSFELGFILFYEFYAVNGIITGQGKSNRFAYLKIFALTLALGLDAIIIYSTKDIKYLPLSSTALMIGKGSIVVYMWIRFAMKKEIVEINWHHLIEGPSQEAIQLVKMSLPVIVSSLNVTFAPMVISECAERLFTINNPEKKDPGNCVEIAKSDFHTVYYQCIKVRENLIICILGSFEGYDPSATYAYQKKDYKRLFYLSLCALILPCIATIAVTLIICIDPMTLLQIWITSSNKSQTELVDQLAPLLFYTVTAHSFLLVGSTTLVVLGHEIIAMLIPVVEFIGSSATSILMEVSTNSKIDFNEKINSSCNTKDDGDELNSLGKRTKYAKDILYAMIVNDMIGLLVLVFLLIWAVKVEKRKNENESNIITRGIAETI